MVCAQLVPRDQRPVFFDIHETAPALEVLTRNYAANHLGLIVPKDNPPCMRVKNHYHTWQEGSSVLFDDTWNHEVINKSSGDRVILLVDVMRPLPPLLHWLNLLTCKGIIRMTYAKSVLRGAEKFSKPVA